MTLRSLRAQRELQKLSPRDLAILTAMDEFDSRLVVLEEAIRLILERLPSETNS